MSSLWLTITIGESDRKNLPPLFDKILGEGIHAQNVRKKPITWHKTL